MSSLGPWRQQHIRIAELDVTDMTYISLAYVFIRLWRCSQEICIIVNFAPPYDIQKNSDSNAQKRGPSQVCDEAWMYLLDNLAGSRYRLMTRGAVVLGTIHLRTSRIASFRHGWRGETVWSVGEMRNTHPVWHRSTTGTTVTTRQTGGFGLNKTQVTALACVHVLKKKPESVRWHSWPPIQAKMNPSSPTYRKDRYRYCMVETTMYKHSNIINQS